MTDPNDFYLRAPDIIVTAPASSAGAFASPFALGAFANWAGQNSAIMGIGRGLVGAALTNPLTPLNLKAVLAGIVLTEAAIIALIKEYENIESPEAQAIVDALNEKAQEIGIATTPQDSAIATAATTLDENATNGALSADPETGEYNMEIVGTTHHTDTGVSIGVTQPQNNVASVDISVDDTVQSQPPMGQDLTFTAGGSVVGTIDPTSTLAGSTNIGANNNTQSGTVVYGATNPMPGQVVLGGAVNVITSIPIIGNTTLPGSNATGDNLVDLIPMTGIKSTVTAGNPGKLAQAIGINITTTLQSVVQTRAEQNILRQDKKPKGMWYLVALRWINKTWGKISELGDFYKAFSNNLHLPYMEIKLPGSDDIILVQAGQRLADLPLEYQKMVLQSVLQGDISMDAGGNGELDPDWAVSGELFINFEGMMVDVFFQELMDISIGTLMNNERAMVDAMGMRGIFDYGNPSTWANRLIKYMQAQNIAPKTEEK